MVNLGVRILRGMASLHFCCYDAYFDFILFLNKIIMLGERACVLHDVERKKYTEYCYVYAKLQHGMLAHYFFILVKLSNKLIN